MANDNPISYISRTFTTIMADINTDNDLKDKPNWFKRLIAGIGDMISLWIDAVYNNVFLRTAYTRKAVQDLCQLIDYELSPQATSSGILFFYVKNSAAFPFVVTSADLAATSESSLNISSKRFEARANETFTAVTSVFTTNFAVNNELTVATDFEYTGHKMRLTTTNTLPAPLQTATNYWVIYVDSTHIKLATTLANAMAGNEITLTSNGVGVHTAHLYSKAVTVYQQDTLSANVVIGTSDGSEWQEFDLPDKLVLEDTLTITISAVNWTQVDTFVNSTSTDKHYRVLQKSDQTFYVQFGDGTYGAIPATSADIEALYSYGGGIDSNITADNAVNTYAGTDSNLDGVSNSTQDLTGGADEESMSNAKRVAPLLLKARDRFVTSDDGKSLLLAYSDMTQAKVNRNVYGVLSAQVLGIASGGGNLSAGRRTTIQNELIGKTILESIDVRFDAATITATNVTSAAKLLSGYSWAGDVEDFFELAYNLILTETGQEIQDKYNDEGIAEAVTLINTIFTTSFSDDDYDKIILLLKDLKPRQFGDTIEESDVFAFIQSNVAGIDYMTIAVFGGGFPLSLAADEITTPGILLLTEIP